MTFEAAKPRAAGQDAGDLADEAAVSDDVREARRPPTEAIPAPRPATSSAVHASEAAQLGRGATVGPVALRRYGPALGIAAAAAVVAVVLIRARRR